MAKMKNVTVRGYNIDDVPAMAEIWNEVVKEGKKILCITNILRCCRV